MAKIIEYKVAQFQYMGSFLDGVKKLMEEGWQPQGGISVTSNWYYQAMVKYEERYIPEYAKLNETEYTNHDWETEDYTPPNDRETYKTDDQ